MTETNGTIIGAPDGADTKGPYMHLYDLNHVEPKRVVIVGGGFAGLNCAIDLAADRNVHIILIDKNNYQVFHPLLYQVAASMLSTGNAAFALRDIMRDYPRVDVQFGEVNSIDLQQRTVSTVSGKRYKGDYLILATGSQANFYGTPGAEEHSFPLYSLRGAEKLRSTILQTFEKADSNPQDTDAGALNFVVVGGGPTGVEMAGALSDMIGRVLQKEFRHVSQKRAQVFLVERSDSVLNRFSPMSQLYAKTSLRKRGIRIHSGVTVSEVTPDRVVLSNGVAILSKTVVWAGGMKATDVPTQQELRRNSSGRFDVQDDLSIHGFTGVYAIGDLANLSDADGNQLPQLAAVAKQAGKHCARNILASIEGKPLSPFVYKDRGILAMVGRNAAVAELGKSHHQLVGPVAFAAWLGVHVALLTVTRAKLEAIVEWAGEYFTGRHVEQLID